MLGRLAGKADKSGEAVGVVEQEHFWYCQEGNKKSKARIGASVKHPRQDNADSR